MVAEYSTIVASQQDAQVSYLTNDNLGSPRIITDENGLVTSRRDFMPFGEEISSSQRTANLGYMADNIRQKFTSYERDAETNLDYAKARYFNSGFGRFSIPDPTFLSIRTNNPQTLNRYVYVLNNPLAYTDPLGLWDIEVVGDKVIEGYKDGKPIYKKKDGKIVYVNVRIIARKTKAGDDGKRLAEQLGLKGKEAEAIAKQVGDRDNIRVSDLDNENIKRVYGIAERGMAERLSREDPDVNANCAGTASYIGGYGAKFGDFVNPETWEKDFKNNSNPVEEENLMVGDTVLYKKDGKATHYGNFLFRTDDGVPKIFSKAGEGARGDYSIDRAPDLANTTFKSGANYGSIEGWYRKK